jgi:light-regulated signal transduction histidine kinase (bacteriophytochrome)
MAHIIEDLLKLSRLGRQQLKVQTTDLNEIIGAILTDSEPAIKDRKIEWRIGNLREAECDQGLIKQVFTNLISNAIKYTRLRETAVIEIGQTTIDGNRVITVQDNGAGFDMKYADKLFRAFQRLHRQDEFEGTGIGLATVRRIIQRHGGRIWAEAEVDKGASFHFTLGSRKTSPKTTIATLVTVPAEALQETGSEMRIPPDKFYKRGSQEK